MTRGVPQLLGYVMGLIFVGLLAAFHGRPGSRST
jgi:hypothetical protein